MREFKTISELQSFRNACPLCLKPLYSKGFTQFDNTILMKASFKADDYIFNISTKTSRINYNMPSESINTIHSNKNTLSSLNPLILTSICPKKAKDDAFYLANEYSLTFNILHNNKQQGIIEKVQLVSETFVFYKNKFYVAKLDHKSKKVSIEELDSFFKVKKTYNLKYENINQEKLYSRDSKNYILNKIQTILLLQ